MTKNKLRNKYILLSVLTSFSIVTIFSVGFSTWTIGKENGDSANLDVEVDDIATIGIEIKNVTSTSSINFDSLYLDNDGRVVSDLSKEASSKFVVSGYLDGYSNPNFVSIRPILQIDSSYRTVYQNLIDKGYIEEPLFTDLTKGSVITSSSENSIWWSQSISSDYRKFSMNYSFSWGAFFEGMNPSEFFDSSVSNGFKEGRKYSTREIEEVVSEIEALQGASWTLYLDVVTTDNTYTVNFNGGTGSTFSNYDTSTIQNFEGLTLHSKINPSIPSKDGYTFNGWSYGSKTYSGSFYLNEVITSSTSKELTMTAKYNSASASLVISYTGDTNSSASASYMICNKNGNTSSDYAYSTSKRTPSVNIGDLFVITKTTAIRNITVTGMEAVGINRYKVISKTCTVVLETAKTYTVTFKYNDGSTSSAQIVEGAKLSLSYITEGEGKSYYYSMNEVKGTVNKKSVVLYYTCTKYSATGLSGIDLRSYKVTSAVTLSVTYGSSTYIGDYCTISNSGNNHSITSYPDSIISSNKTYYKKGGTVEGTVTGWTLIFSGSNTVKWSLTDGTSDEKSSGRGSSSTAEWSFILSSNATINE